MTALDLAPRRDDDRRSSPNILRDTPLPALRRGAVAGGIEWETHWRQAPQRPHDSDMIRVSRWKSMATGAHREVAPGHPGFLTIAIALLETQMTLSSAGRLLHDGDLSAGAVQITGPGDAAEASFREPCDMLHVFVPLARVAAIAADAGGLDWRLLVAQRTPPTPDPAIDRLAWSLVGVADYQVGITALYIEGITTAILARLLNACAGCAGGAAAACPASDRPVSERGLVKWRLKRVLDYVQANLAEPLKLADLARCAGLSRMHFAAQFRAATGIPPHEYVLRKRIERSQEILRSTSMPLAEVALSVGFQTQAHFTTVFGRLLDEPPGRWRTLHRVDTGFTPTPGRHDMRAWG